MSHLHFVTLACVLAIWLTSAHGQSPESAQAPQEPPTHQELNVKYAKARMLLAEAELLNAMQTNREAPGTIATLAIERLKSDVTVAERQLEEAKISTIDGTERIRLLHAEEKIRLAQMGWEKGQKLREQGMISDLELQRLKLKHDVAKLHLSLMKNPRYFSTLLEHVEARVDRMGVEILMLDQRLSKLELAR